MTASTSMSHHEAVASIIATARTSLPELVERVAHTLWEVANALRLPLDGAFLVIAAETEPGHDPIPRAESALAVIDVRSVWRLDAEVSLGVLSLPDRSRNGAVLTVLDKHATHRIGASPVFGELHQAGWALQLARLALGPNTIRYRMRRIEAGTGRVLANPGDVAELVTAVRAWRDLPHS
jgi:hypothetical protein